MAAIHYSILHKMTPVREIVILLAFGILCSAKNFSHVVCRDDEIPNESITLPHIVGGDVADKDEFPWMAELILNFEFHYCGGVLIDESFVLTAAHCMEFPEVTKYRFGVYDRDHLDDYVQTRKGEIVYKHEKYGQGTYYNENDIALVKLDQPVKLNEHVKTICIAPSYKKETHGMLTVSGWGDTKGTGDDAIIRKVRVPALSDYDCKYKTSYKPTDIAETMLCAGYRKGGKDSCQGDSGGPLMHRKADGIGQYHVGVVSWGFSCAEPNYPGVYTETAHYADWIVETMKKLSE